VAIGGTTIERSADFTMAELGETLARDTVRLASERFTDEGFFAQLDESKLDAYEEPLIYLAQPGELRPYSKDMTPSAKRRFLTEFWKKRHFPENRPRNDFREGFYGRVNYANKYFVEKGRGQQPGWKSDRGRVFARNGVPDDSLARQQEGQAPRYTAWKYSAGKARYYVFTDRTGIGNWVLLTTNDLRENSLPGWEAILGGPALQDLSRFIGNDFYSTSRPTAGQN
jgi:GWxTD domain-containing protein